MNTSFSQNDCSSVSPTNEGRRAASGFTLMEILIAIALLVTIVAVAVTNLLGILRRGQESAARVFVTQEVDTALMTYRLDTGSFPTTAQGLQALNTKPEGVAAWKGPYIKNATLTPDPWGADYNYAYPGTHNVSSYDCWSSGMDKTSGTADDIGNW